MRKIRGVTWPAGLGLVSLVASLGAACDQAAPSGPTVQVSDSSGVRVVEVVDEPAPSWTVRPDPILSIGGLGDRQGYDLLQAWASLRLTDGSIAVSDAGSSQLRRFDAEGEFVEALGGLGEGPGEFRLIAMPVAFSDGSIVVADAALPRLTVFGPGEGEVATVDVPLLEGRVPRLRGFLTDDHALHRVTFGEPRGGLAYASRDTMLLAIATPDGGWRHLGRFPAREKFNQPTANGTAVWTAPMGRDLYTGVGSGRAWVGVSDRYELLGFGATGELETIIRLAREPTPITDQLKGRFFDHQLDGAEDEGRRQLIRDLHAVVTFGPSLPAFSNVRVDRGGSIWVKEYSLPWEDDLNQWRVFASDGSPQASVQLPLGLEVHDIGDEYVLGRWRDELEIEYIRLYELVR